jgi:hypothetical protein
MASQALKLSLVFVRAIATKPRDRSRSIKVSVAGDSRIASPKGAINQDKRKQLRWKSLSSMSSAKAAPRSVACAT